MTPKKWKKRRLIRGLLWLSGVGIFLLFLLPVWFPWLLQPVLNRYGLRFAGYDRVGWTRFTMTGVHGEWSGTKLEAQHVESVLPTTWLWRRFNDRTNGPPLITLSGGHLMIGEATTNAVAIASAGQQGSAGETLDQISRIGMTLQRFLPVADLTNCSIQVGSNLVSIPHAHWEAGRLNAVVRTPAVPGQIEVVAQLDGESELKLAAGWEAYEASLHGGFLRTNAQWRWQGELGWRTNRAELTAQFSTNGWWPTQSQVNVQRWQIPTKFLKVENYENLVASLTANLISNHFDLQATGFAKPSDASVQRGFPEVRIALAADGDPRGVYLRTLSIQSPLLNADLTNTVGITWTGELQAGPAQLRVSADLAQLAGAAFDGRVEGDVQIEPQTGHPPVVRFRFAARQVRAGRLDAKTILVRGGFTAPVLKLAELRADFADGSELIADGALDIETQRIEEGNWRVTGPAFKKLLSAFDYSELGASGEFHGPLTNLTQRGEVSLTAGKVAGLKPFDLKATWSGQQQHLASAEVAITAGASALTFGATADLDLAERAVAATLNRLALRRGKEELYSLQQPCAIKFRAGNTNAPGQLWSLAMDALNCRSEIHAISTRADFAWPARGEATLNMTNVAFGDFADFLEADLANVLVAQLAATAHWSNGPVHSIISAAGSMTNATGELFSLRGNVKLGENLTVEQLTLATGYAPTLSVTGTLPVKVLLERGAEMLVWDKAKSIALAATWKDGRPEGISVPLGSRGQLVVSQPDLLLRVSGTPDQPSAELALGAAKLDWQSPTNDVPLPRVTDVQIAVEVRPSEIRLKAFGARLDDRPITATGEWPLAGGAWKEYWSDKKLPDWNPARGRLELREMPLALLASYLPDLVAPEGQLDATLELKAGKRLEGILTLTNAATRPVGTITPMRDIAAVVRLDGNRAVLEDLRGQIGGQPVRADGYASVADLNGGSLDYQVNLHGTNVPLVRRPEMLLRGDFELSLRRGSNAPPLISGLVVLRDGLFVQNTSALVWSGPVRPELRPPYFSVTNEPFGDWKLDLAIRGDRFLRARTPVFSGILSAGLQLQGSLRAPVLTGDARVNSGRLVFPFGSLTLNQGFASFSGNDLRGPDLQLNASGRNYRYELRLEVKGPADGANVILSSTPPLTSEQILLMLTAGELPQTDFSFSTSARAGRVGTFLGTDLLSRYLGTDPAKERLIFRSGESISGAGRLTYSVEYRLTDRWSIMGAYDEFSAFTADLKWKVLNR